MALPQIEFCNSWVYDDHFRDYYERQQKDYPPYGDLESKKRKIERAWQKEGLSMLREIQKVSGLKWKERKIQCFVVGKCVPFSFPLSISIYEKYPIDYTVDVLAHELIHQLFIQNEKETKEAWKYFFRKYKEEDFNTVIHIPLHAMHFLIFMKFFGEKRLRREIDSVCDLPDYRRAWDIVMKEGAEDIVGEFKSRINIKI